MFSSRSVFVSIAQCMSGILSYLAVASESLQVTVGILL